MTAAFPNRIFQYSQSAVRVALDSGDLDLAKLAVRQVPQTSEWQKRQLWKRIAEIAVNCIPI